MLFSTMNLNPFAGSKISPDPTPQDVETSGTPTQVPGIIYRGQYIRIGLNKGGTFGVNQSRRLVGFQYPIGRQFESLAWAWWGEGYVIAYKIFDGENWVDNIAYWWPSLGWLPPPFCRMQYVGSDQHMNDSNRAVFWSKMRTIDGALTLTFAFNFPKHQKYVLLETFIQNSMDAPLKDVLYKRIVDWDIHGPFGFGETNYWTNDAHAAYASLFNPELYRWIVMSVAGYANPKLLSDYVGYVDLYAWDDIDAWGGYRTTRWPGELDWQSHHETLWIDGNAAIYYDLWDMRPGESKHVWTVYQAGWHEDSPPP
jgi:hypothetical protein